MTDMRRDHEQNAVPSSETMATETTSESSGRPFWLSVIRWTVWLAMLMMILAFAARRGGEAFIYQNF